MTGPDILREVRCRGCKRIMGFAPGTDWGRIYCSQLCVIDYPAVAAEDRDSLIATLNATKGRKSAQLAAQFGMTRQRIDQILAQRRPR